MISYTIADNQKFIANGFELVLDNREINRMCEDFNLPFELMQHAYLIRYADHKSIVDAVAIIKYGNYKTVISDGQSMAYGTDEEIEREEKRIVETLKID